MLQVCQDLFDPRVFFLTGPKSLGFAGFLCGKVHVVCMVSSCCHLAFDPQVYIFKQVIMCLRVREFAAKLLQPHCAAYIQSGSHYYSVATVILGFAVVAVNVLGHFSKNELLIYVSELLQFGMCVAMLLLYVSVHIFFARTSICDAVASSFRKRRRLVHVAFAVVEITMLLRTVLWLKIAVAIHDAAQVHTIQPFILSLLSFRHPRAAGLRTVEHRQQPLVLTRCLVFRRDGQQFVLHVSALPKTRFAP
jgi:hypothetical protein